MKNYIKSTNPLKFLSVLKQRKNKFKKAAQTPIPEVYPVNALAKKLHPARQYVKIASIVERGADCKTFRFVPDNLRGTEELAYFSAGKYVTVFLNIAGVPLTRAYSLNSSPKESLKTAASLGFYEITVKGVKDGIVSSYILQNWKTGDSVELSAPEGHFEYVGLRDAPVVVGIAGGSGITPFLSMAKAICDGTESFKLILLYGSRDASSILFKKEFDELEKQSNLVQVIHVLSNEEAFEAVQHDVEGKFEKGFITSELIKKYAPQENYSVFLCGPQAMYNFAGKELQKLPLEKKFVRYELFGEIHSAKAQKNYPGCNSPEVNVTVAICGQVKTVQGSADDTIMQILEKNGIQVPARCRSGECGWCHSYLKSGKVFIPQEMDLRRKADEKFNFIHPCCTFPLTDIEIEVPNTL